MRNPYQENSLEHCPARDLAVEMDPIPGDYARKAEVSRVAGRFGQ